MKRSNELKKIAVIPIYNEEKKINNVLTDLEDIVDIFILINDGSIDKSVEIIKSWQKTKKNIFLIDSRKNKGMSWAVKEGFSFIQSNQKKLEIKDNDIIIQIDSDAQHCSKDINEIIDYMRENQIDYLIPRRILNGYPFIKVIGNELMSGFASILTCRRFYDIENGFRLLKAEFVPQLLNYTVGFRYSWAQEMVVIASKIGLKIDNTWKSPIIYYRKRGTRFYDAFINCFFSSIVLNINFYLKNVIKCRNI